MSYIVVGKASVFVVYDGANMSGRLTIVLALLALLAGGCRSDAGTVVSPDPTPGPVTLRVAEAPVDPATCPTTTLEGQLVENQATGLGIIEASGVAHPIIWPHGYSGLPSIGGAILYDASGQLVAYTGEIVRIHGVLPAANGGLFACGPVTKGAQPGS